MANPTLLKSATVCGILHALALAVYRTAWPVAWGAIIIAGIITSILNHGTTSELAKWGDRGVIAMGVAADIGYTWLSFKDWGPHWVASQAGLACCVGLYTAAKAFGEQRPKHRDMCHSACHSLATVVHIGVLACVAASVRLEGFGVVSGSGGVGDGVHVLGGRGLLPRGWLRGG